MCEVLVLVGRRELLDVVAADAEEGEVKKPILLVPAVGRSLLWFFQMIMNSFCFLKIFLCFPSFVSSRTLLLVVSGLEVPHQIFQMGKQEVQVQQCWLVLERSCYCFASVPGSY